MRAVRQAMPAPRSGMRVGLRVRGSGIEFPLTEERPVYVLGTGRSADIRVPDEHVSRLHCALLWRHGLLVLDKGSRNGTWINDVRCERAYLHEGAELRVGRTTLVVFARECKAGAASLARDERWPGELRQRLWRCADALSDWRGRHR